MYFVCCGISDEEGETSQGILRCKNTFIFHIVTSSHIPKVKKKQAVVTL
jgi:hypothetical protein